MGTWGSDKHGRTMGIPGDTVKGTSGSDRDDKAMGTPGDMVMETLWARDGDDRGVGTLWDRATRSPQGWQNLEQTHGDLGK